MGRLIAPRNSVQYMLRLPPGMRQLLNEKAERNGRSVNTEIVAAIERHLAIGDNELVQMRARLDRIEREFGLNDPYWKEKENA